jgi:hypothetical protein
VASVRRDLVSQRLNHVKHRVFDLALAAERDRVAENLLHLFASS